MPRYKVPRVTIGPTSKEIILELGRTTNADDVTLNVKRRKCGEQVTHTFEAYHVCDTTVHFEIPESFMMKDVARGFYDGEVMIDDCVITNIEIIKAPSVYVKEATIISSDCNTKWEEPSCDEEDDTCSKCHSLLTVDNGCPTCCQSEVIVSTHDDNEYIGE